MSTKIKGSEFPLAKIFSSDFDYNIPSFQRPYSWTEDQTRELFNDLHDFYVEESSEEQYFLGSIVLVKEDGWAAASDHSDDSSGCADFQADRGQSGGFQKLYHRTRSCLSGHRSQTAPAIAQGGQSFLLHLCAGNAI